MAKGGNKAWNIPEGQRTQLEERVIAMQSKGFLVPERKLVKTPEQIEGIRRAGIINTGALDMVACEIKAGMTTAQIDRLVAEYLQDHGARAGTLGYEGFPASCCTSINEVVCHGIPSDEEELWEGDIINVDLVTVKDGYYADAARMFCIGEVAAPERQLVEVTKEALRVGIAAAQPWTFVGDIGRAIEQFVKPYGYGIVRDLAGHGVGLDIHEEPVVDHYDTKKRGMLLVPGMVITIEPMINLGTHEVFCDEEDGWTIVTEDEQASAQWEHMVLITETGNEILSY